MSQSSTALSPAPNTLIGRLRDYQQTAFQILDLAGDDVLPSLFQELELRVSALCEKADSYGHVLSHLESFVEQCKARKKEWDSGRATGERAIEALKSRMRLVLEALPDKALQGDEYRFFLTVPVTKMEIDRTLLPKKYLKKVISFEPDREKIAKDVSDGKTVPGVAFVGTRQLRTGRPK